MGENTDCQAGYIIGVTRGRVKVGDTLPSKINKNFKMVTGEL